MKLKNSIASCRTLLALTCGLLCPSSLYAFTEIYNTEGTFEWVCPPGVTSITVECWGGGGAGGGAFDLSNTGTNHAGGGGGGGGAYARKAEVPVTPGLTYTVIIPPAATNPLPVINGATVDGADVSFTGDSSVTVTAVGGKGGFSAINTATTSVAGVGGLGGDSALCVGDPESVFSGGNGATRPINNGGAGGGGAGDANPGGNAEPGSSNGGVGGFIGGGNGGNGRTGGGSGNPGASPGGGGAGAKSQTVDVGFAGGTGGIGQIRLSDGVPFSSVKQDNSEDLFLPASWTDGVPGLADVAVWDSTVTGANTTLLGADLAWAGISIQNPGGLVTIDAGNTLTLGLAETDIDLSAATADLILNCDLALNAANVWNVQAGRTLSVAGLISGSGSVSKQGDGTAILSGANTFNAGTAGITIAAGTLQLSANEVIPEGAGRGNVIVNGTLDLKGFSETLNGLDGSGIVDTTATDGESTLTIGIAASNSNFTGIIQNTLGTLNLVKSQGGTAQLSNANTFSGTATVNGGTLQLNNPLALQSVAGVTLATGFLWINPDGTTITAPITLEGGGRIISPTPSTNEIRTITLNGGIGGTGDLEIRTNLNANNRPIVVLGAAGTHDGNTTINNPQGGTLAVQQTVANALPATTVLTINNVGAGSGRYVEYDLNGFGQSLAGLTSTGAMANRAVISNSSDTTAALTINNLENFTFPGVLGSTGYPAGGFNPFFSGDNFALTKDGIGMLTLSGAIAHTGVTNVIAGSLVLSATSTKSFYPTTNGISNKLSGGTSPGTGMVRLDGAISLQLAAADPAEGNSWLLVDSTNLASPAVYGDSFAVSSDLGAFSNNSGVWTLIDSGNLWTFTQSSGSLTVGIAPSSGYAVWAAGYAGLNDSDPSIDFDLGGLDTGIEYVVGGDPTDPSDDATRAPTTSVVGTDLVFEFRRTSQANEDPNANISVQYSSDLAGWTKAEDGVNGVIIAENLGFYDGDDQVVVTLPATLATGSKIFARLNVDITTP